MTQEGPSRRRFLAYVATFGAVGVGGGAVWVAGRLSESATGATGPTPTSAAALTTLPTATAPTTRPATVATTSSTTSTTGPPQAAIDVICREAWGALPVSGEFTQHQIERLTVHHTGVVLDGNSMAPARARQHQLYHQERGWADLAYHYLIDANGNVYEGRPVEAVGDTGTEYDPTGHFLICCEGNFSEQEIPDAQLGALAEMLAWAAGEFDVSPDSISGHRDWAQTSCPGDDLYEEIEQGRLERAVAARIASGGVAVAMVCGEEGLARVADVEAGLA